jgi:copper chaperone
MKTLQFTTNINCQGCIAKVTPFLNSADGIEHWEVDTANPQKILIVETNSLESDDVVAVLQKAGYKATALN